MAPLLPQVRSRPAQGGARRFELNSTRCPTQTSGYHCVAISLLPLTATNFLRIAYARLTTRPSSWSRPLAGSAYGVGLRRKRKRQNRRFIMNKNDLLTVITSATATAALTLTAFWPGSLGAGDDPQPVPPKIAQPKLAAGGLEISIAAAEGHPLRAGDEPVLELTAVNPTAAAAQASIQVALSTTSPADALSRVVRTPAVLWQADQSLALGPKEVKKVLLKTGTKLEPNRLLSVLLSETGPGSIAGASAAPAKSSGPPSPHSIVGLSFSTISPKDILQPRTS